MCKPITEGISNFKPRVPALYNDPLSRWFRRFITKRPMKRTAKLYQFCLTSVHFATLLQEKGGVNTRRETEGYSCGPHKTRRTAHRRLFIPQCNEMVRHCCRLKLQPATLHETQPVPPDTQPTVISIFRVCKSVHHHTFN